MGGGAESDFLTVQFNSSQSESRNNIDLVIDSVMLGDREEHKLIEAEEIEAYRRLLAKLEAAIGGCSSVSQEDNAVEKLEFLSDNSSEIFLSFSQENVALRPTMTTLISEIPGFLFLTKRDSTVVMSWQPYLLEDSTEEQDSFIQEQRNVFREVPLSQFHSIRRFSPPVDVHYIIIVLKSGLALPPLYFRSGGIKAFLSAVRTYSLVSRDKERKDVYLINYVKDTLQASLSQLGLQEAPASKNSGSFRKKLSRVALSKEARELISGGTGQKRVKKPSQKAEDLAMSVLEKLSVVTKVARGAANQVMSGILEQKKVLASASGKAPGGGFKEPVWGPPGRAIRREEVANWHKGSAKIESGSSSGRQGPLTAEEFKSFLDREGRISSPAALRQRAFSGGVEPSVRGEVWKFLLGYFPFASTSAERAVLQRTKHDEYFLLRDSWMNVSEEEATKRPGFKDQLNAVEKDVTRTDPTEPFLSGEQNPNVQILRSLLTTYSFYNPQLGYCQGMCDLLTPLLYSLQVQEVHMQGQGPVQLALAESDTFWCFEALMRKVGGNFHPNQTAMQAQLFCLEKLVQVLEPSLHAHFAGEDCLNYFFCFRWLFLLFKREFPFQESLRLFDSLFSRHPSRFFHLFLCVAVLEEQEKVILEQQMDFETLLKHVNELSGKIDLQVTIKRAEELYRALSEKLGEKLE